jgi:hypothetical protein
MRIHLKNKRVHLKTKGVHHLKGGKLFKSGSMDSGKIHQLTSMMNKLYDKEQPNFAKKLTGKKFMI